jgi:hypothetical protein
MHKDDIYLKPVEYVAERSNYRLAKFTNLPTKEIAGTSYLAFEGVPLTETWSPERDWNQLMLVVDEIEKIDKVQIVIKGTHCFIAELHQKDNNIIEPNILCQFDGGSRLESVYRCCVDFVTNVAIR